MGTIKNLLNASNTADKLQRTLFEQVDTDIDGIADDIEDIQEDVAAKPDASVGTAAPTSATVAKVGDFIYHDSKLYFCIAVSDAGATTWKYASLT